MKEKRQFTYVRRRAALSKRGFSLVEMLVVIAVIGIIAAIAVPTIGSITRKANEAKARRNAQNLAAVGASAQAVGYEYISTTKEGAADELVAGVYGTGQFAATIFRVPNLVDPHLDKALHYLKFEDSTFIFRASHSHR
jgi:prepilin-type N-terminal cleavage/methylation domain-containing protein